MGRLSKQMNFLLTFSATLGNSNILIGSGDCLGFRKDCGSVGDNRQFKWQFKYILNEISVNQIYYFILPYSPFL